MSNFFPKVEVDGKPSEPNMYYCVCVHAKSLQSCLTLCDHMDCSLPSSSCLWDFLGKNTGVGCHALLQGIFPTQGSTLRLLWFLYCRRVFTAEPPGKPNMGSMWSIKLMVTDFVLSPFYEEKASCEEAMPVSNPKSRFWKGIYVRVTKAGAFGSFSWKRYSLGRNERVVVVGSIKGNTGQRSVSCFQTLVS